VLVGENGSGKTILLSHVADALIEFAKEAHGNVLAGQTGGQNPYFKIVGPTSTQRSGTGFGIALLEFSDGESTHCYVDKSGTIDPGAYREKMSGRFEPVASWPPQGNHNHAPMSEEYSERLFRQNSICYFPSARHERPHWLNKEGVTGESVFQVGVRVKGMLRQPVVVESAAQENKQWLLDVMLDSRADYRPVMQGDPPELRFEVVGYPQDLLRLQISRANVQILLQNVLQDASARLVLNYRTVSPYRLSIRRDSGIVPSLDHLSAGQANLFNLFATIIRYADMNDITKSFTLPEIKGIVLVDEIDAHAHSNLQYEVLPKLLKLFPRVQFILTSHSPLFLLGMEREYGSDGFQLIEMPGGQTITTERFSEFERSWEVYRRTAAYEKNLQEALRAGSKPLVLTERETDPKYIKTALELLECQDLLDNLDIEWVCTQGPQGSLNSRASSLKHIRNVLEANPGLTNRKVLLLYDCDTNKPPSDVGLLKERTIPRNIENTIATEGIENLLPPSLFEEDHMENFISKREQPKGFGLSKLSDDGSTLAGVWQLNGDDQGYRDDLAFTYRRASGGVG